MNNDKEAEYLPEPKFTTSGSSLIEALLTDPETQRRGMRICRYYAAKFDNVHIEADDLFQKTCIGLWKGRERIEANFDNVPDKDAFFLLFSAAARNICKDEYRKYKRKYNALPRRYEDVDDLKGLLDPRQRPDLDYVIAAFKAHVEELPEAERQMIQDKLNGDTTKEIADKLGVTSVTVLTHLKKVVAEFLDLDAIKLRGKKVRKKGA